MVNAPDVFRPLGGSSPRSLPYPDFSSQPWMQAGFVPGQVAASNAAMPAWLQISQNWGNDAQKIATDEYMSTQVNPAVAAQRSRDIAAGSASSTFAGARAAATQTLGARQAMLAGIDAKNGAVDRMLRERSSYNDVPIDQGLAGRLYNNAQNQYGVNNANYQAQQQNGANRTANIIGAGANLLGYAAPAVGQFASGLWQGMKGTP